MSKWKKIKKWIDNTAKKADKNVGKAVTGESKPYTMRNDEKYNTNKQEVPSTNDQLAEHSINQDLTNTNSTTALVVNNKEQLEIPQAEKNNILKDIPVEEKIKQPTNELVLPVTKDSNEVKTDKKSVKLLKMAESLLELGGLTKNQQFEAENLNKDELKLLKAHMEDLITSDTIINITIKSGIINYYKIVCKVLNIVDTESLIGKLELMPLRVNAKELFKTLTEAYDIDVLQQKNDAKVAEELQKELNQNTSNQAFSAMEYKKLIREAVDNEDYGAAGEWSKHARDHGVSLTGQSHETNVDNDSI